MTLALTPDMLATAYDYMRTTQPFRRWKLPPADEVEFRVVTDRDCFGYYRYTLMGRKVTRQVIALSTRNIGYTYSLMQTMAHEMIHMRLLLTRKQDSVDHGPNFLRLAHRVCRLHGFDPKVFC